MKKWVICCILLAVLAVPARADEFTAPQPPEEALELMPHEQATFSEGLWHVLSAGLAAVYPNIAQCLRVCVRVLAIALLLSIVTGFSGKSAAAANLAAAVAVACILLEPANALIREGAATVTELSQYGKLLLPVMTGALAAQGGTGTATALYAGTAVFNTVLGSLIASLLVPLIYIFLALSVVGAAAQADMLMKLRKMMIGTAGKGLRVILYVFTGYLTVTGVVGGAADQMTVKAAKLTISGMVPVVGSIMADASETILVSAGMVKGAAGIYGLLSAIAIGIGPFLNIGVQYLALKATAGLCALLDSKPVRSIVEDFAAAMGLLLAMTGTMCLLILISTVCFMKGMG